MENLISQFLRKRLSQLLIVFLGVLILMLSMESHVGLTKSEKPKITPMMAKLHIPFIANKGQTDRNVKYYANTFGGTVFITKEGEIIYSLPVIKEKKIVRGLVLKEEFVGGKINKIKGEGKTITKISYFKGKDVSKWKGSIPTYGIVGFEDLYKGIELELKAYGNNIEKLFYIKPGYDSEKIKVKMEGAKSLKVNEKGELEVITELGSVNFTKALAYQKIGDEKKTVNVDYVIYEGNIYSFNVGKYDKKIPLIIDPLLL